MHGTLLKISSSCGIQGLVKSFVLALGGMQECHVPRTHCGVLATGCVEGLDVGLTFPQDIGSFS